MSRAYFFGILVVGIFLQGIHLVLVYSNGLEFFKSSILVLPLIVLLFISIRTRKQMKSKRDFDERAQYLAYKIFTITSVVFLFLLLVLADFRYTKLVGYEIRDLFGIIIIPLFMIIYGIVGMIIISKES